MLYSDPAGSVEKILFDDTGTADGEVTDEYGVLHRIWRVNDPATIRLLTAEMDDKKLIIADGHHRYETALGYSRDFSAQHAAKGEALPRHEYSSGQLPQPPFPEAAVMMTFVNMDSDGLVILPTHRVVHSLANFDADAFAKAAAAYFTVTPLPDAGTEDYIAQLKKQSGTAFIAVTKSGALLLNSKADIINAALASIPDRQRKLDLTQTRPDPSPLHHSRPPAGPR
jgi:hypothetical protein